MELDNYEMGELMDVFDQHAMEVKKCHEKDGPEGFYNSQEINLPLAFRSMIDEIIRIKKRLDYARVRI